MSRYAKEHSNALFASIGEQFVIFFFNAIDFLSICENLSVGLAIKSNKVSKFISSTIKDEKICMHNF